MIRVRNGWARAGILLAALLPLLAGCGVKWGYNKLDWIVRVYVDDYVSLDGEQQSFLQQRLGAQLNWHRREQLPRYVCWIERLKSDLEDGLTRAELDRLDAELLAHWRMLMRRIAPDVAQLLATASDTQLHELRTNFERRTAEYKAKYLDVPPSERQRERSTRMERRLKRWIGRLTAAQEQAVDDWSRRIEANNVDRLAYRGRWRVFLTQLSATRPDAGQLTQKVEHLLIYPQPDESVEARQQREMNRNATKNLLIQIDSLLQTQQRVHLQEGLTDLAHDLEELSGGPVSEPSCRQAPIDTA